MHRDSFTLIELLVVIAIVAILSAVVIITLNPAELLKQSRDSNRLSDLNTLNKALALYEVDVVGGTLGATSTVYVSLPDTSATCANLGLPALPSGYQYGCVTETNLRKTDGTGWIPVNLTQISSNTPLGFLPTDPTNTTSTGLYYTYVPGGSYEIAAAMESSKFKLGGSADKVSKDGGRATALYEVGSDKALIPFDYGDSSLKGWYTFEEGSGSSVPDRSGNGKTATWNGSGSHYTAGKLGTWSGQFDGTSDYLNVAGSTFTDISVCAWVLSNNPNGVGNPDGLSNILSGNGIINYFSVYSSRVATYDGSGWRQGTTNLAASTWYHACLTLAGSGKSLKLYTDGNLEYDASGLGIYTDGTVSFLGRYSVAMRYLNGKLDDVRVYNRVLSLAEIQAIYNAR